MDRWDYNQDYHARRTKRRMRRSLKRFFVLLIAVLAILFLAWITTTVIQSTGGGTPANTPVYDGPAPVKANNEEGFALPEVDNSAWNTEKRVEQTLNNNIYAPDSRMLSLPENGRVEMSYFDSATFIGDSLTQGFEIYPQGIPNAHYCAYKGVGIQQIYNGSIQTTREGRKEVPMEALVASNPKNIYIQLGANAMVYMDDESIIAYYSELLDQIRANVGKDVHIYIQSLTPVSQDNSPGFDILRISSLNNLLAKLSVQKNTYFLDLMEPLAGDDGYLRADFASRDGYHLTATGYGAWVDYLVTHTAYDPENPYEKGSHHYQQAARTE